MLTIVKEPALISCVGNPIIFEFQTDNLIEVSGTNSVTNFSFTGATANNQYFTINFSVYSFVFSFKTNPNESGNEIVTGNSALNAAIAFEAAMKLNYYIDLYYVISRINTIVTFTAKNSLTIFDILFVNGTVPNNSPITVTYVTPIEQVNREFFSIFTTPYIYNTIPKKLGEEYCFPNSSFISKFDVSDYFKNELSSKPFHFPLTVSMHLRNDICKKYFLQYAERFGTPSIIQKLNQTNDYYVLNAGLSHYFLAKYNENNTTFWINWININHKFLTFCPDYKKLNFSQFEKLYFLAYKDFAQIKLYSKIYYFDGTSATEQLETYYNSISKGNVLEITVTPEVLGILYDADIYYIEFYLKDNANVIVSEIRHYVIDHKYFINNRNFIFKNSLGGWDSVRCVDFTEINIENSFDECNLFQDDEFTSLDFSIKRNNISELQTFKTNTGFNTKEYIEYLRDFLLSTDIYEIENDNLYVISLTSKKHFIRKDNSFLYSLSFEYVRAYTDNFFSNLDIIRENHNLTDLIGGKTTDLDSIVTIDLELDAKEYVNLNNSVFLEYKLIELENENNESPTYIVPLDYDSVRNPKNWELQCDPFMVVATGFEYENGFNVSEYGASDGSITLEITGGISPFTFLWDTEETIQNLENLPAGIYSCTVTDAAGQMAIAGIILTQPMP